jgi:hypothetical protein
MEPFSWAFLPVDAATDTPFDVIKSSCQFHAVITQGQDTPCVLYMEFDQ